MSAFETQIDKVRKYFEEHKAECYPFENAILREKDEYIKSLYFRMLCTLIRYTGEASDMQVLYVRRLIAGSNAENEFQDYMKMALALDISDVEEFISIFREDSLRYYFCIDGAILLAVAEMEDKKYELLAELVEMLGITHEELEYLTTAAHAIIVQNSELFDEAKALIPDTMRSLSMFHYVRGFYAGAIVDTPEEIHIYSCDKSEVDLLQYGVLKNKKVVIENISGVLKSNIYFKGCAEVVIRNCKFTGNKYYFEFGGIGNVLIENCALSDFTNRFARTIDTNNLIVRKNRFVNCGYTKDMDVRGGVIFSEGNNVNKIILESNELLSCYIARETQRDNWGCTGIFFHHNYQHTAVGSIAIKGNRFSGCQCRKNGNLNEAYISAYSFERIEEGNICTGSVTRIFEYT
ncbi:MAG: right-handed parallel beta-helix repeat-containing protein [Lachnospiraceae bacterium]